MGSLRLFRRALTAGLITGLGAMPGVFLVGSAAWGGCWGCRKPAVDLPVPLALGTIRTPEFLVQREPYLKMIRAHKNIPLPNLDCMMGLELAWNPDNCNTVPLLQADWIVWDGSAVVDQGAVRTRDQNGAWSNDSIDRYIGDFVGKSKREYVLEVKFVMDGSALNVTDPHLIVMMSKPTD